MNTLAAFSVLPLILFDGIFLSLIFAAWIHLRATQPPKPSGPVAPDFVPDMEAEKDDWTAEDEELYGYMLQAWAEQPAGRPMPRPPASRPTPQDRSRLERSLNLPPRTSPHE
jgi:hypothetical protein